MITIEVGTDTPIKVDFVTGMNVQNALEKAYALGLSFGLVYYGEYGYIVVMLNHIYDAPNSGMYWELFINGTSSSTGIDSTILNDGDIVGFQNVPYYAETHKGTLLEVKHLAAIK